jgi:MFS family permease
VIIGCAVMAAGSLVITLLPRLVDPPGDVSIDDGRVGVGRVIQNVRELRRRPGVLGVLFVAGAQFFVVGALDIIVVVAAEERLGLGTAGPGLLLTLIGVGSIAGGLVSTVLIRRERLAPMLIMAMLLIAVLAIVFGLSVTVVVAFVTLPLIGVSRSVIDLITDVLLHRSAPPDVLASVYAVIEIAAGIGLLLGSIGTQALLAISGLEATLFGVGAFFVLLVVVTVRPLRLADRSADVPVVSMSLIRGLPVFATLPRAELETLCRSAIEVTTEPGDVVIQEGDIGDRYYAVMSGTFVVTVHGVTVHRAVRGQGFGEVALLASVPRTATVTSVDRGLLLTIDRTPFLIAVTGHDSTRQAAWGVAQAHGTRADLDLDNGPLVTPPGTEGDAAGGTGTSSPTQR